MNPERFVELTEAYGADEAHWPVNERNSASALLRRDDDSGKIAAHALSEAQRLDAALSSYTVALPDAQLINAINASFPAKPAKIHSFFSLRRWRKGRLWVSGIGLLGIGAAGIASGMLVTSFITQVTVDTELHLPQEATFTGSVFSHSGSDWSDE